MAKLTPFRRLLREDFPDQGEWIGTLLVGLNQITDSVYNSFNKGLSVFDNLGWQLITRSFMNPANVWIIPTLGNNWAVAGGTSAPVRYKIDSATGDVVMQGRLTGGTLGTSPFTLPVGYQPPFFLDFITLGSAAGPVDNAVHTSIHVDGTIISSTATASAQTNAYWGLDGIRFEPTSGVPAAAPAPNSAWPYIVKSTLKTPLLGVIPLSVVDTTPSYTAQAVTLPLTVNASSMGDGRIRIDNVTGLMPGRTYTLNLLAIGK